MKPTLVKIDVTKIDKKRLYKGKKGTYLDAVIIWSDQTDKYGNDGMVVQQVTKEERQQGVKGEILGNVRNLNEKPQSKPDNFQEDPDLPF